MRNWQRVWSNTAQTWARELVGTVYKERVETLGQVSRGYERYQQFVELMLPEVFEQVMKDRTTRQALMLWPYQLGMYDPPCFFAAQVLYREPDVHLVVYMRSSDEAKFGDDLLFFRWMVHEVAEWIDDQLEHETRNKYLTVFKGSDHTYEAIGGS